MSFFNPQNDLVTDAARHLFSVWDNLRRSRPVPDRFEFEPGMVGKHLPCTFILDDKDTVEGVGHFRLCGSLIEDMFAAEGSVTRILKGRSFREIFENRAFPRIAITTDGSPKITVAKVSATSRSGIEHDFELFILPMTVNKTICRALGVLYVEGPHRMDTIRGLSLNSVKIVGMTNWKVTPGGMVLLPDEVIRTMPARQAEPAGAPPSRPGSAARTWPAGEVGRVVTLGRVVTRGPVSVRVIDGGGGPKDGPG